MDSNKELWIVVRRALLSIIAAPTKAQVLRALSKIAGAIAKHYALEQEA
jgi:hypothetical protein